MDRNKILELAREADLYMTSEERVAAVERFAALIERAVRGDAEPVAFEFQHEDTGLIDFVDPQQVEWGFQKNNPRWQLIGPVFRHPTPAVVRQLVEALSKSAKYLEGDTTRNNETDKTALAEIYAALAAAKENGL